MLRHLSPQGLLEIMSSDHAIAVGPTCSHSHWNDSEKVDLRTEARSLFCLVGRSALVFPRFGTSSSCFIRGVNGL